MSENSNWHGTTIVLIRKGKDVVVSAAPYFLNKKIAYVASEMGVAYFDLTEDTGKFSIPNSFAKVDMIWDSVILLRGVPVPWARKALLSFNTSSPKTVSMSLNVFPTEK